MGGLYKKIIYMLSVSALCLMSACGDLKERDIVVALCTENCKVFDDPGITRYYTIGVQRYKGKPVRFLAIKDRDYDIYMQKEGQSAELIIDDLVFTDSPLGAFIDDDEKFVLYGKNEVVQYDAEGNELISFTVKQTISQIVKGEMGHHYALATEGSGYKLFGLDITDMKLSRIPLEMPSNEYDIGHLCFGKEKPYLVGGFGVYLLDEKKKEVSKIFDFEGSSYSFASVNNQIVDVEYQDEMKLIIYRLDGSADSVEYINVSREREVIRLRAGRPRDAALQRLIEEAIQRYNSENKKTFVYLDDFDETTQLYEAFVSQTGALIAENKIDLLFLNADNYDGSGELLRGGKLLDLRPMLTEKGIDTNEYYPIVFKTYETEDEGIYGVNLSVWGVACAVYPDLYEIGSESEYNLNRFLSYVERAGKDLILTTIQSRSQETEEFLCTSKSLCGSIDWVNRTCNFNNDSFRHLVSVIDNCADEGRKCAYAMGRMIHSPSEFISVKEAAEEDGLIALPGVFFDDGVFPVHTDGDELVILKNSKHKEASMDFLAFLLSDEIQSTFPEYNIGIGKKNVDRKYVSSLIGTEVTHFTIDPIKWRKLDQIASASDIRAMNKYMQDNRSDYERTVVIDKEAMEEYMKTKEKIRSYPFRESEIIRMTGEELEAFYSGSKSFEEVCEILNNRVGLYLKEHAE